MANEMIALHREGDVFVLEMVADQNRWNTTFTRAFDAALDEVEAAAGRIALVTASSQRQVLLERARPRVDPIEG